MDIKHFIKAKLQDYFKSRLKLQVNTFKNNFDSDSFENVALLFPVRGKNDMDLLRNVVRKAKQDSLKITVVVFSFTMDMPDLITDRNLYIFNADSFNYKWQPNDDLKQWLEKRKFDLLINFDFNGLFELKNLHNLINAGFKIANQSESLHNYCDLTINIDENKINWEAFYTLAIRNLKMLKIKKNDTRNRSSNSNTLQQERGNR